MKRTINLDKYMRFIFPAPSIVILLLIVVFPLAFLFFMSTQSYDFSLQGEFIGLENYVRLIQDPRFLNSIFRTALFVLLSIGATTILGLIIALFLNGDYRGIKWYRVLFIIPMFATPVAVALVWRTMFHPQIGILNYFLQLVGLPGSVWLGSTRTALASVTLVEAWRRTPIVMLILLAGLRSLPKEPFESSIVDGANAIQRFIYITIPLLRPTLFIAVLINAIDSIRSFDTFFALTEGGPRYSTETLSVYSYLRTFQFLDFGYGSSIIITYLIMSAAFSMVLLYYRRSKDHRSGNM